MSKNRELCDAYNKELFGTEMEVLGFQYFYKHRFIKIINDEVMIWFGLIPYFSYVCTPVFAIVPLFTDPFDMIDYSDNFIQNYWPYNISVDRLDEKMRFGQTVYKERYYMKPIFWNSDDGEISFRRIREKASKEDTEMFHAIVKPIIKRITNLETAVKEIIWIDYILSREQKQPSVPDNYVGRLKQDGIEDFCVFYKMYDQYQQEIFPNIKQPSDIQKYCYKMCQEKRYDQLEEEIRQRHAKTMVSAKRRLKYVPEKSTLFAPDNLVRDNPPDFSHIPWEYYAKIDVESGCVIRNI